MEQELIDFINEKQILVSPDLLDKEIDSDLLKKIINKKNPDFIDEAYIQDYLNEIEESKNKRPGIIVTKSYNKESKKRTFQDFVSVFNNRFKSLSAILKVRSELDNVTSISRLYTKKHNDKTAIIGMVSDKQYTKNNNIILSLEDTTGLCTVIVKKGDDNKELFEMAENLVLDEV